MLDDIFFNDDILASEKDILANMTSDRIIDQVATLSKPLQKLVYSEQWIYVNVITIGGTKTDRGLYDSN